MTEPALDRPLRLSVRWAERTPGVSRCFTVRLRLIAAGIPVAIAGALALASITQRDPREPTGDSPLIGLATCIEPPVGFVERLRIRYRELLGGSREEIC